MQKFISNSAQETRQIAKGLAERLTPGTLLVYTGGMGMGKTCFTTGLAEGLGIDPTMVSSPTFALVNEYRGGRLPLYHFDMYRVESFDSLYSTGFFDYLDMGGVVAVEWSEHIAGALPPEVLTVAFERLGEEQRAITIDGEGF